MTDRQDELLMGIFYDGPVEGLEYTTQSGSGMTNQSGEFYYRSGETVTFSVGDFVLGSAIGRGMITPAHLAVEVDGDIKRLKNWKVTNLARFLQSLHKDDNIETGIIITDRTRDVVGRYCHLIDFEQPEDDFSTDANIRALFDELGKKLRTGAQARNHLRRTLHGIKKRTDVKIPTRDGAYLPADVFTPLEEGRYPAILSLGVFGKAFHWGCICDEDDLLKKELMEDQWFEGNLPETFFGGGFIPWENGETANTTDWVPHGYAVVRVDGRGICNSPGIQEQFSLQESEDLYDSIEWAARQPWCTGKVGLWGTGYFAMNSYNAAQLQPPSLAAMIPVVGDVDSYRDYLYTGGGLYSTFNYLVKDIVKNYCGEWQGVNMIKIVHENPFCDPDIYGPTGKISISCDLSKITVPFQGSMGLTGTLHTRGSSEAFINAASKDKRFLIIGEPQVHYWAYSKEFVDSDRAFFDYWLKGIDNGIMDRPPVRMMVPTGWRGYYWQEENEWPIARTQYTRYYLDASASDWEGDGKRDDFHKLSVAVPEQERSSSYDAGVEWENDNNWMHGVSFVTEPMAEDTLLAGYMKLVIWVSSSSHDMELHASVRVMDEDKEVPYPVAMSERSSHKYFPIGWGALKVSHRKLDLEKCKEYRPFHTHLKEDYQPLKPGQVVECEVEIWPTVAKLKKGYRLRLDVQPVSGDHIPMRIYDIVDQTYQKGSSNTIYTGPDHPSYLQLPVIPPK